MLFIDTDFQVHPLNLPSQLILNVDGCIAVCFVDLLRDSGAFTSEEADEYIKVSCPTAV
jgi:hypothetical protein